LGILTYIATLVEVDFKPLDEENIWQIKIWQKIIFHVKHVTKLNLVARRRCDHRD
jgi:hypothetical protein